MHRKQKKRKKKQKKINKSKQKTNKNKAMSTFKTCGPKDRLPSTAAHKPLAYTTL